MCTILTMSHKKQNSVMEEQLLVCEDKLTMAMIFVELNVRECTQIKHIGWYIASHYNIWER